MIRRILLSYNSNSATRAGNIFLATCLALWSLRLVTITTVMITSKPGLAVTQVSNAPQLPQTLRGRSISHSVCGKRTILFEKWIFFLPHPWVNQPHKLVMGMFNLGFMPYKRQTSLTKSHQVLNGVLVVCSTLNRMYGDPLFQTIQVLCLVSIITNIGQFSL